MQLRHGRGRGPRVGLLCWPLASRQRGEVSGPVVRSRSVLTFAEWRDYSGGVRGLPRQFLTEIAFQRQTVDRWFKARTVFFITGVGRSGTQFLSRMLSQAPRAAVFHEPILQDFDALLHAHRCPRAAMRYISGFRKKRMYALVHRRDVAIYGETNSNLRFHASALKRCFPEALVLHLSRDGRDVVRSILGMPHYTESPIRHFNLRPAPGDAAAEEWENWSRFERVCWLWAIGNGRLWNETDGLVRLEDLLESYPRLRCELLDRVGLQVDEERWRTERERPANATKNYSFPHWRDWTREQEEGRSDGFVGMRWKRLGYW